MVLFPKKKKDFIGYAWARHLVVAIYELSNLKGYSRSITQVLFLFIPIHWVGVLGLEEHQLGPGKLFLCARFLIHFVLDLCNRRWCFAFKIMNLAVCWFWKSLPSLLCEQGVICRAMLLCSPLCFQFLGSILARNPFCNTVMEFFTNIVLARKTQWEIQKLICPLHIAEPIAVPSTRIFGSDVLFGRTTKRTLNINRNTFLN